MKLSNKFKIKLNYSLQLSLSLIALGIATVSICNAQRSYTFISDSKIASSQYVDEVPTRFKAVERILAIGDLHGDFKATQDAFRLAGATNKADKWIGGKLVVIQIGDQLDRGDGEKAILDFLERLVTEAKAVGGALHILNGNHEIMNVNRELRYVVKEGFREFASVSGLDLNNPTLANVPAFERPRVAAFLPGGPYAMILAKRNIIVIVGDVLFVHGGVLPKYVNYGLEKINREVRQWIRGETPYIPSSVNEEDSPVWSRHYSDMFSGQNCKLLEQTLKSVPVKYMVVGHTIQKKGINAECNGKVWRIDVGMSKAFGGPVEILEIKNGKFRVLKLATS